MKRRTNASDYGGRARRDMPVERSTRLLHQNQRAKHYRTGICIGNRKEQFMTTRMTVTTQEAVHRKGKEVYDGLSCTNTRRLLVLHVLSSDVEVMSLGCRNVAATDRPEDPARLELGHVRGLLASAVYDMGRSPSLSSFSLSRKCRTSSTAVQRTDQASNARRALPSIKRARSPLRTQTTYKTSALSEKPASQTGHASDTQRKQVHETSSDWRALFRMRDSQRGVQPG